MKAAATPPMRPCPALLLLALALLLGGFLMGGCDRPFIEPVAPEIEVVAPDLSVALAAPTLALALRVSSFRSVRRVEVQGRPAAFDAEAGLYRDTLALEQGLNRILVRVLDDAGTEASDTLYALHLPFRFAAMLARPLPEAIGGHAATRLDDGRILLTGGAPAVGAPALEAAYLLDPRSLEAVLTPGTLRAPRMGHTASLLPDGRVLLAGGSRHATPAGPADFVTKVEIFDPSTGRFSEVPLVDEAGDPPAQPMQRAWHTAAALSGEDGRVDLYLYGGLTPRAGAVRPSPFMRTFRLETNPDRLVAVGPADRFALEPMALHTQTPLEVGADGRGRYLVAGAAANAGSAFVLDFRPNAIDTRAVGAPAEAREGHAAAPLLDGLTLVAGGRTAASGLPLSTAEAFAAEPGRFFRPPEGAELAIPRWGHTATNLGGARILLVGGFLSSGQAVAHPELFLPQ